MMEFLRYRFGNAKPFMQVEPALDEWAITHYDTLIVAAGFLPEDDCVLFRLIRKWGKHKDGAIVIWTRRGRGNEIAIEKPRDYVPPMRTPSRLPGIW